jgi:hypothetical protein
MDLYALSLTVAKITANGRTRDEAASEQRKRADCWGLLHIFNTGRIGRGNIVLEDTLRLPQIPQGLFWGESWSLWQEVAV